MLHQRISILKNRTGNDTAFGWLCHQASLTSYPVVCTISHDYGEDFKLDSNKKYHFDLERCSWLGCGEAAVRLSG